MTSMTTEKMTMKTTTTVGQQTESLSGNSDLTGFSDVTSSSNDAMEGWRSDVGMTGLPSDGFPAFLFPLIPNETTWFRTVFIILYVAVFAVCVIGNFLVIFVITCHRKTRNNVNFFLANLAAADLSVGIFCVIPQLSNYVTSRWYLGRVMCKLLSFVQTSSYACSVVILTIITLERYLAISQPLQIRRYTQRRFLRSAIVACVWVTSAAYAAPLLFVYDTRTVTPEEVFCTRVQTELKVTTFYVMVDFILLYAFPLIFMSVVYVKIGIVLWRSSLRPTVQRPIYRGPPGARDQHGSVPEMGWPCRRSRTSKGGSLRAPTWMLASGTVNETGLARLQKSVFIRGMLRDGKGIRKGSEQFLPQDVAMMDIPKDKKPAEAGSASVAGGKTKKGRGERKLRGRDNCYVSSSSSCSNCHGRMTSESAEEEGVDVDDETESNYVSSISNGVRLSQMPTGANAFSSSLPSSIPAAGVQKPSRNPIAHRRKVIRLLMAMVGSFAVCMLPHHIRLQWQEWSALDNYSEAVLYWPPITSLIFFFNSALNPFLYALISDRFRQSVTEVDWFMLRRLKDLSKTGHL